jgi:hypothetical protein
MGWCKRNIKLEENKGRSRWNGRETCYRKKKKGEGRRKRAENLPSSPNNHTTGGRKASLRKHKFST